METTLNNNDNVINGRLIYTNHVAQTLDDITARLKPVSVHVLVDANTASFVLPRLQAESQTIGNAHIMETGGAGDLHKNLDTLAGIWQKLGDDGATRRSLLINIGGGVITDMGAFAAATFKRGIRFINVPTTLLGAVDASVGGKSGINFNSLKNEVGVFADAETVIISTTFFNTLNSQELLSGYAEMIKHAMLTSDEMTWRLLRYDVTAFDPDTLLKLLQESVEVKCRYVNADPTDKGLRQALNFGHTFGHAFEELAMERDSPLSHGYAVAFGMVAALILSHMKEGFPSDSLHRYSDYVRDNYGAFPISCKDYDRLLDFMAHDKKNSNPEGYTFTLLKAFGDPVIGAEATTGDIKAALDIYCDMIN
ncbi:MAG: 3-dehydroquinate synthase [Bacteroidales bacterium]|nr:3-dehydroquinate synthase [Bacteroidales bacterium]